MIDDYDESSGWMFLLVPAHPGFPGQIPQSRKTVVCVCVWLTWKPANPGSSSKWRRLNSWIYSCQILYTGSSCGSQNSNWI